MQVRAVVLSSFNNSFSSEARTLHSRTYCVALSIRDLAKRPSQLDGYERKKPSFRCGKHQDCGFLPSIIVNGTSPIQKGQIKGKVEIEYESKEVARDPVSFDVVDPKPYDAYELTEREMALSALDSYAETIDCDWESPHSSHRDVYEKASEEFEPVEDDRPQWQRELGVDDSIDVDVAQQPSEPTLCRHCGGVATHRAGTACHLCYKWLVRNEPKYKDRPVSMRKKLQVIVSRRHARK